MDAPIRPQAESSHRITQLERQVRRLKALRILALAGALAALAGSSVRPPEVLQAERIELVSSRGARLAVLAADSSGVTLTLLDGRGEGRAALRLDPEPRMAVLNGAGREVAGLGAPREQHLAE